MKTIDEWYSVFIEAESFEDDSEIIDSIQKDAWNAAIDDIRNHPKVKNLPTMQGMKIEIFVEDLLKIKK